MSALPALKEVSDLFAMLFGDRTVCKPCQDRIPNEQAAVIATYHDNSGAVRRAVTCDLAFANSAGASLSMIPTGAANDAVKAGVVPDNILANLHEVMNIAVNLFTETFGGRLELVGVQRAVEMEAGVKAAITAGAATSIEVSIPRYSAGRVSLISL